MMEMVIQWLTCSERGKVRSPSLMLPSRNLNQRKHRNLRCFLQARQQPRAALVAAASGVSSGGLRNKRTCKYRLRRRTATELPGCPAAKGNEEACLGSDGLEMQQDGARSAEAF
jgi:hypothetical protein